MSRVYSWIHCACVLLQAMAGMLFLDRHSYFWAAWATAWAVFSYVTLKRG